jgi:hypothetical protein
MHAPLSIRLLDEAAAGRPFVPTSVVARLTSWSEGTIRNRATSRTHPLPFRSLKIGGKRVFPVESLRDFLISLEQPQAVAATAPSEPKPRTDVKKSEPQLRKQLGKKFATGRKSLEKTAGNTP